MLPLFSEKPKMLMKSIVTVLLAASCAASAASLPTAKDLLITSLPGLSKLPPWKMYAGRIPAHGGRELFVWFTESQNDPSTDPFTVWQTGGPGCSSLLAFLSEMGPFRPQQNLSLAFDEFAWNRRSNMIWVESPACVGFSTASNPADCMDPGDKRTSADIYQVLVNFFKILPEYANLPVITTAESYGGHYNPWLTQTILQGNDAGVNPKINMQTMMTGNAWTVAPLDNLGALDTWWQRILLPKESVDDAIAHCNLSIVGPFRSAGASEAERVRALTQLSLNWRGAEDPAACNKKVTDLMSVAFDDVNIYDIYIDECHHSPVGEQLVHALGAAGSPVHRAMSRKINEARAALLHSKKRDAINPNPCISGYLTQYLNERSVQEAIHAIPVGGTVIKWEQCGGVQYNYTDLLSSVIPVYQYILSKPVNVLVYSGDVDAIVPSMGTLNWLHVLTKGMPITEQWRAWKVDNGTAYGTQTGGYTQTWGSVGHGGVMFTTVRDAGHEVPFYQAKRGYTMFEWFAQNQTMP